MARKALPKAISVRLSADDYYDIFNYSEHLEIAMADLMRLAAREYMDNHLLVAKSN